MNLELTPMTDQPVYPHEWEANIVLSDGATAYLRPIRPEDDQLLVRFHGRQSPESVYFRFFSPRPRLSERELAHLVNVDYRNRMAFVVLEGDELIAIARYEPVGAADASEEAEVAFFVDDEHNRRGLATILLEYLAVAARKAGRRKLTATVLPENQKMLKVFRAVGFETTSRFSDGYVSVTLDIESDEAGEAAIASRERQADARSVDRFLTPESVAVIGAARPRSLGYEIVGHLLNGGFTGSVFPVNRAAETVHGLDAFASVSDIATPVDIAVIAVPQPDVDAVLDDCIRADVGGVVVTSAGFSESGANGLRAERNLVAKSVRNGLRLLGPNCMGVINTAEEVRLNGSLVPVLPPAGSVAVSTQSGALGRLVVEGLTERGLGITQFVALGNKADVSGNDLLQFWELDERTKVVLMHLESVGNPGRFQRIARSVSAVKPVIALIPASGLELAPQARPVISDPWAGVHWPAGASLTTRVEQAGVVAVDSFPELLDAATVLCRQPVPADKNVVMIGNSGAALRLAAAEVDRRGLQPANLIEGRAAELASNLPPGSRLENPVDLTYRAEPEHYAQIINNLDAYDGANSVVVVHVPPLPLPTEDLVAELNRVHQQLREAGANVCAVACIPDSGRYVDSPGAGSGDPEPGDYSVPVFNQIHSGVRALAVATRYGLRLEREAERDTAAPEPVELGDDIRLVVNQLTADDDQRSYDQRLTGPQQQDRSQAIVKLLRAGALPVVDRQIVSSAPEAVAAARSIGYPVVLKATGRGPLARNQDTGVALDLADESSLVDAYQRMSDRLGAAMDTAEVQAMASAGIDAAVSVHRSPEKGTAVTLGRGGAGATPVDARPVAMLPLDRSQAERLVAESELGPVLAEVDGGFGALCDVLVRLGALVDEIPEVAEMHLAPVLVSHDGVWMTDIELIMATPPMVGPRVRRLR